jgi:Fic family protein
VLLPPHLARELHLIYLTKGAHGTTAIEGNALSEEEVRARIEKSAELPKSMEYQQQEIDNIVSAYNLIVNSHARMEWDVPLTVERIKQFNLLALNKLPLDEKIRPGETRTYAVSVADYMAPNARYCDELLGRLCEWLNAFFPLPNDDHPIANAIIKSIICHVYLAWIHPFGDGNGRTARLLEFNLLVASGVPAIAAHLLSDHYNKTRSEYLRELSDASKSGGDLIPLIRYAMQGMQDGLNEQFKRIEDWQARTTWRDHVYSTFREETGATSKRRRQLVLAISDRGGMISRKELPQLTPELAALYATKTPKTLSRDLKDLEAKKLLFHSHGHYGAATWNLEAFKSKKRPSGPVKE